MSQAERVSLWRDRNRICTFPPSFPGLPWFWGRFDRLPLFSILFLLFSSLPFIDKRMSCPFFCMIFLLKSESSKIHKCTDESCPWLPNMTMGRERVSLWFHLSIPLFFCLVCRDCLCLSLPFPALVVSISLSLLLFLCCVPLCQVRHKRTKVEHT